MSYCGNLENHDFVIIDNDIKDQHLQIITVIIIIINHNFEKQRFYKKTLDARLIQDMTLEIMLDIILEAR